MSKLDLLDKKIMYELDLNARITASQLAKKLNKSKETINFRIKRLIEKQYIKRFYTVFNTSKLGWYYTKFYVKFANITPQKEKEILEYLSKQHNMAYLASIEGYYDCIFLVMVRNSNDMVKFLDPFMKLYGKYIYQKDMVTFLTTHRLNERFLFKGTVNRDVYYPIQIENYHLDDIDKKILNIISTNARTPLVEIAKQLKVDSKLVKYRLKKLEKDNIILAYVSSPNFDKLGLQFTQINISLNDSSTRKQIIEFFKATNKCLFAIELVGKYDLLVEIHLKDNKELRKIIEDFRNKFVNVYNDYDVSTINKEYLMVWGAFS